MSLRVHIGPRSLLEFLYLVLLWMAFVSKVDKTELICGLAVAAFGMIADAVVNAKGLGHFRPRLRWLLLSFLEPWYVLNGMWAVVQCFPRALTTATDGYLKAIPFDVGDNDPESATRRALATMLLTMPPNSLIIGIDRGKRKMLIHEMKPEPPSFLSRELGGQE